MYDYSALHIIYLKNNGETNSLRLAVSNAVILYAI